MSGSAAARSLQKAAGVIEKSASLACGFLLGTMTLAVLAAVILTTLPLAQLLRPAVETQSVGASRSTP